MVPRNTSDKNGVELPSSKMETRRASTGAFGADAQIEIRAASLADLAAITALLREADLPPDDITPHLGQFLVATSAGVVLGAIGAEIAGTDALLRSLVVAANRRGSGLGGHLVAALEDAAASWGVERWWLLTTTAQTFFAARGFRISSRTAAPAGIRSTGQFSGGFCSSAVCLTRERKVGS
jgi:amino-acid N-acetyltransferase